MKRPYGKVACAILATMMIVGGCSGGDKKSQSWDEHNSTRAYLRGGVPRSNFGNSMMWYMIGRAHSPGVFSPIASSGRFSAPSVSRMSSSMSIGKMSVPAGSVRGGSFSGGFSAGG